MPYWNPEESLEDYINLALHLCGSTFRVELAAEPTPFREPTESAPGPAPFCEPIESAPEPAPFREPTESASNLGVILETDLSFSSHVKAVTKSAYYHLKNIARIRCSSQELELDVSSQDLEKLVHAFITSRVDYCNDLLTGLPKKTIRQLQLIQNAAARILTRTRKSEHITPVLRSLHWLPVTFRIDFKVLLLVYKSLNGLGPKYMADMITEYKPNRPLRSLGSSQLEIPRVHTKQGESAFSYYAARSWNQLPEEIKCAKTLATFKSSLKIHLFSCAFVE